MTLERGTVGTMNAVICSQVPGHREVMAAALAWRHGYSVTEQATYVDQAIMAVHATEADLLMIEFDATYEGSMFDAIERARQETWDKPVAVILCADNSAFLEVAVEQAISFLHTDFLVVGAPFSEEEWNKAIEFAHQDALALAQRRPVGPYPQRPNPSMESKGARGG